LEEGDASLISAALGDIARAKGMEVKRGHVLQNHTKWNEIAINNIALFQINAPTAAKFIL
jgi:hypothetical protein